MYSQAPHRLAPVVCCLLLIFGSTLPAGAYGVSGSNGINGGFVGSDLWFRDMSRTATRGSAHGEWQAAQNAAIRSGKWTQVALVVTFPGGNPFPGGRLPELRVTGSGNRDYNFTLGKTGKDYATFYGLLPKGGRYSLGWFYFSGKETFGSLAVPRSASSQTAAGVRYVAPPADSAAPQPYSAVVLKRSGGRNHPLIPFSSPRSDGSFEWPSSDKDFERPVSDGRFLRPRSDHGFKRPVSDGRFRRPESDHGSKRPVSDGHTPVQHGFQAPQSDKNYHRPTSGG